MSAVTQRTHLLGNPAITSSTTDAGQLHLLRLLPAAGGWSLVGLDGEIAFQASGTSGRQACLEFAFNEGVLAVLS
jgi:hypothetical protein